jgi:hypothetical protein
MKHEKPPGRRESPRAIPPNDVLARFAAKKSYTHKVVPFPVLTEAALKRSDMEAVLTLRMAADTSQEVLKYTSDRIIDYLATVMDQGVYYASIEEVAFEITRCADRLTQIAKLIPHAPNCPEAGARLRDWFGANL